jgi:diguanylate cyclase (GGDEF)-like protein/PAS domain S-box-containing protein
MLDAERRVAGEEDVMKESQPHQHAREGRGVAARQPSAQTARLLERSCRLAGVGAWEWDPDTDVLVLTDAARALLGLRADAAPTLAAVLERFGPDGGAMLGAALQRTAQAGEGWDVELPCHAGDGSSRTLRVVGGRDGGPGARRRVDVVMHDVSEAAGVRAELERTLERLALATHGGGIGVWELDLRARALCWDDLMWRLHGETPQGQTIDLRGWRQRVHPDDRRSIIVVARDALSGNSQLAGEWRVLWPDGSEHVLRATGRVLRDAAGRPLRLFGVCQDISEQRRLQRQLRDQRELLEVTLHSIADAVLTTDAQGRVTALNPVARRLTGWGQDDALGQPTSAVFQAWSEDRQMRLADPVLRCLQTALPTQLPTGAMLMARDGELRAVDDSVAPIRNAEGRVLGAVLVFRDVTLQRRQFDEIHWRASHDGLTGLVNRGEFHQRLARIFERARDDGSHHALLAVDLDRFKLVNDHCGHAAGDAVLREVARRLEAGVRGRDTVARLGGDEFAAILENCSLEEAQHVAQKLCDSLDQYRYVHGDQHFRIGASIGVAPLDVRWPDAEAALREADACCMIAKAQGRNRVQLWSADLAALRAQSSDHHWDTRLQQALDEDRLELDLQRVLPVSGEAVDDRLRGELLLRLRERDGTRVMPGAFLAAAERFHLAPRLDRWVLRQAVALLRHDGPQVVGSLGINLSAQTLRDASFQQEARALLQELGPQRASALCLEIAEMTVITQLDVATRFINQMRSLGVRITLDNFGTGAASFGYLKTLPIDLLKIDGHFVRRLLVDPLDQAAVRSFIDVSRTLGIATVAVCVETREVLAELARLGVHKVQGFLLHRPQPLGAVLAAAAHGAKVSAG